MAASSISWMPSQGRHSVNIGTSLSRAVKARKQRDSPAPTTKKSNLPERDFYAFRYSFKPNYIDGAKPASIETKRVAESTQVVAEFPNTEGDEIATYNGNEQPSKEIDCVLIYDEDTGQYSLEKLDAFVSLQFIGKKAVPTPVVPDKGKRKQEEEEDDLENLILQNLDDKVPLSSSPTSKRPPVEEIEEGEEQELPLRQPSPLPPQVRPPPPPSSTVPDRPTKALPNSKSKVPLPSVSSTPTPTGIASLPPKPPPASKLLAPPAVAAPASKPGPVSKPKEKKVKVPPPSINSLALPEKHTKAAAPKKNKSVTSIAGAGSRQPKAPKIPNMLALPDEEILELPKATPPMKTQSAGSALRQLKAVVLPATPTQPKAPAVLSLPGAGEGFALPGSLPSSMKAAPSTAAATVLLPPISAPAIPPGVSDTIVMEEYVPGEEEDLEQQIFGDFGEDEHDDENEDMVEQEIDAADLAAELEQQMTFEMTNEVFGGDDSDDDEDMEDAMEEAMEEAMQEVTTVGEGGGEHIIPWNKMPVAGDLDSEEDYSTSDSDSD